MPLVLDLAEGIYYHVILESLKSCETSLKFFFFFLLQFHCLQREKGPSINFFLERSSPLLYKEKLRKENLHFNLQAFFNLTVTTVCVLGDKCKTQRSHL